MEQTPQSPLETPPMTTSEAPVAAQATQQQPKLPVTWEKIIPLILAFLAIMTGIGLFVVIQKINNRSFESPPVTVIVTPTPSPTPIRNQTLLSTTSAYLTLQEQIATLSSKIEDFEKDDPALSPPSLVLPLGF